MRWMRMSKGLNNRARIVAGKCEIRKQESLNGMVERWRAGMMVRIDRFIGFGLHLTGLSRLLQTRTSPHSSDGPRGWHFCKFVG